MTTGLLEDLEEVSDARKTAVIDQELHRLNMDIVALQETRLLETGSLREKNFTFFWQGKSHDSIREHGVGFAVRNTLLSSITPPAEGNERLLTLKLNTSTGPANLICAYAPTLNATNETKDKFYDDLSSSISSINSTEAFFILGDFNARVGADHNSWPTCLGHHGIGKMNENGQRLLELCCFHNLCITNTFFNLKPQHKVSWFHPRSKHWHQLDLILTPRSAFPSIKLTRSYQSADCDSDHSLVVCCAKLRSKKIHQSKTAGRPRIDITKTRIQDRVDTFARTLQDCFSEVGDESAQTRWEHFRDKVYEAAIESFGKRTTTSPDWFEAYSETMLPVIEEKRLALSAYKTRSTRSNLHKLRTARQRVQATARKCANEFWLNLCSEIQTSADRGNIQRMYDGIKKALGPTQKKCAPLKSASGEVLKDRDQQMTRWVEHYAELNCMPKKTLSQNRTSPR